MKVSELSSCVTGRRLRYNRQNAVWGRELGRMADSRQLLSELQQFILSYETRFGRRMEPDLQHEFEKMLGYLNRVVELESRNQRGD